MASALLPANEAQRQAALDSYAVPDAKATEAMMCHPTQFDVVFCNVIMPYLSGMDLYRLVLAYSPLLAERFVFISGGGICEEVRAFLANIPDERLEKPFSNQNLRGMACRFVGSGRRGEPA